MQKKFNPHSPTDRIDFNIAKLKTLEFLVSNALGEYEESVAIQVSHLFDEVIFSLEGARDEMNLRIEGLKARNAKSQSEPIQQEINAHLDALWGTAGASIA